MESKLKEARPPLDHRITTEQYKKDESYFRLYTSFTPNLRTAAVTGKFYSVHDSSGAEEIDEKVLHDIHNLAAGPQQKWKEPYLESHRYGWYSRPLIPPNKDDPRFHHPSRYTEISRFGALLMQNKSMLKD